MMGKLLVYSGGFWVNFNHDLALQFVYRIFESPRASQRIGQLFDLIEPSKLNAKDRERFAIEMGFRRGVFENRSAN